VAGVFVGVEVYGTAERCGWALPQPRSIVAGGGGDVVATGCRHPERRKSPVSVNGMTVVHHGAI